MSEPLHARLTLNGADWQRKSFLGLDWLLRSVHMPDTRDVRGWGPGTVPGSVVHDLWTHGEIPDPYVDRNSLLCEWASQRVWVYRKNFTVPDDWRGRRVHLCFEGVDYEAHFFLNGAALGDHRSMYTPARFDVGDHLHYGADNLLAVVIEPAPVEQPQVGRTSLVRTHKSRMTYWWDFCPRLVHQGIWDSVYLDVTGPARIADVWIVETRLADDYNAAIVKVQVTLDSDVPAEVKLTLREAPPPDPLPTGEEEESDDALPSPLSGEGIEGRGWSAEIYLHGMEMTHQRISTDHIVVSAKFIVMDTAIWWPNGHGEQPLYDLHVAVIDPASGFESDSRTVTFGIRRVEFVPNDTPDTSARPYTLQVNERKIYIKGWNWVPMDLLYGVERPEKLEHLLTLAQQAHVNLLRVWGGGLIEKEAFYDVCDRLGILVWQEFIQSSSGIDNTPPDDPDLLALMEHEARQIIPRRRNHPSLAVWCGGNELAGGPEQPLDESHPMLAMLCRVVSELDPGRVWLPTSPSGRAFSNNLTMIERDPLGQHDVHGPWEHQGLTGQYTLYNRATSLLHSEFGAEGITNLKTLEATVRPEDRWPVTLDQPAWFHRGAWWVKDWRESLGEVGQLEKLVQGTQFLQAESVRYAVESNRRRKYHNSGSLPWQFNEPYPMAACTSAVDYFGHPKPLYYAVKRAYAPLLVAASFDSLSWSNRSGFEAALWCANSALETIPAVLYARLGGPGGEVITALEQPVTLAGNAITPAGSLRCDLEREHVAALFFLDMQLVDDTGAMLAANRYVFTRDATLFPALHWPAASIIVNTKRDAGEDVWRVQIHNPGAQVALFVWLEDARPRGSAGYVYFSDNYLCLLPGEMRTIRATWNDVPPAERQIEVSGWNIATSLTP